MARNKQTIKQPVIELASSLPPSLAKLEASQEKLRYVSFDFQLAAKSRLFQLDVQESIAPHVIVTVPDEWPHVKIAPLYDVHLGSVEQDSKKYIRDIRWLAEEPYALTFNGGDLWDNAIKASIASSFANNASPNEQYSMALDTLKLLLPKMMFGIPGNHEQRTSRSADIDVPKIMHEQLGIPYSPDYMFCTIKWRNNKFRILAHHGTGAAASAGGQRNSARKDMSWAHGVDLYWTGHLHQALTDLVSVQSFNQFSDEPITKEIYCIISPSYVKYYGGYAAAKRLAPGARGLTVAVLMEDGRIDVENHANGKRL